MINWSILSSALASNPGETFTQGLQQGATRSALGRLATSPNDSRAMNALATFNPEMSFQYQDRQRQLASSQAEAAHVAEQTRHQQLANRQQDIIQGATFLQGVTDDATYQSALQRAHAAGVNIEGAPPTFDPAWAQGVQQTAQSLLAASRRTAAPGQPHYFEDNAGNQWQIGQDGQPQQVFHDPTPRVQLVPDGQGGFRGMPIPNMAPPVTRASPQGAQQSGPAVGTVEDGHRFNGGDPADPSSWTPVEGGASPSNGSGGFLSDNTSGPAAIDVWNGTARR
jgi:hypothetical protein